MCYIVFAKKYVKRREKMSEFLENEGKILCRMIKGEPEYARIAEKLSAFSLSGEKYRDYPCLATGLCDTPAAALIYSLATDEKINPQGKCCAVCVPDEKSAYSLLELLRTFTKDVFILPRRDYVFYNVGAFSHEFEQSRIATLRAISKGEAKIVICVPEALATSLPAKEKINSEIVLRIGEEHNLSELLLNLVNLGYSRTDTVEGKGQFSVRGDILDLFPTDAENPIRMEFFGDELDCAGYFDVMTQRRYENADSVVISPARELLISSDEREKILSELDALIKNADKKAALHEKNGEEEKAQKFSETKEKLTAQKRALLDGSLSCIDKFLSCLDSFTTLFDYIEGEFFLLDTPRIKERLEFFGLQLSETLSSLAETGEINLKGANFYLEFEEIVSRLTSYPTLFVNTFTQTSNMKISGLFNFRTKPLPPYTADFSTLCDDIDNYIAGGYTTLILTSSPHSASVLAEMLAEAGKKVTSAGISEIDISALDKRRVYVTSKGEKSPTLPPFELPITKLALLGEGKSHGTPRQRMSPTSQRKSKAQRILSYQDLSIGDFVVHSVHGIGRYEGIKTLTVAGVTRDYITIIYAGDDVIYVPADQLDRVSRYAGASENVRLSKLGNSLWQKTKTRVKSAAKDMAKELIALYAERRRLPGYAFGADTEWQKDFEGKFIYEETDGQLEASREIKADMQESYPMDRLLCGDVGFGKTEVALRAVFKCVSEGKQAAILVPTTILAWQHYETTLSRFCDYPISVEVISRFRTQKEIRETVKKLKTGQIDVIIGTHRLLSEDIEFKDLGLLVVDEEQRFGVAHKERLKKMSKNVDVLTLTATPIPRTLNMAMSGIRDLSVLEEAPQDRYPVQTYVTEYDFPMLCEAIKNELRRGGQVFYLRNKVDGMESVAERIRKAVPNANIAIAHGKMTEEMLSDIWHRLVEGEIDVLVCTTIIETGVDVSNANTLIIEHADRMGLSQLHQIRGRVGRSNRRAYAYLTYDGTRALSELAEKRLLALREFTEFGSGFKIAMRDLEIRGAGNLLGAEQSGHLEAVGYDLYIKLLEEAILEEKGEAEKKKCECTVEFGRNAYIPESYISLPGARIDAYKRIAAIENKEDADDIIDELFDRYGNMPKSVETLIKISLCRARAEAGGIIKLTLSDGRLAVYPATPCTEKLRKMHGVFGKNMLYSAAKSPFYSIKLENEEALFPTLDKIFNVYSPIER